MTSESVASPPGFDNLGRTDYVQREKEEREREGECARVCERERYTFVPRDRTPVWS